MGTSTGGGKLAGHLAVAGAYAIFGLNIVFCKDIANAALVSPIVLFTLRAIGASLLFWGLDLFRRPFAPREHVSGPDLLRIVVASALGLFIPQLTFLKAITISTSIDTAIMGTLSPIFTMFFAFFFVGEPITGKKAGGVALSFAAVLFLIFNSFHGESTGTAVTAPLGWALLLLNSLSFSLYLGLFRPLINRYSVVTFMKWMFLFSLLMSLPFSLKGMMVMDWSVIPGKVAWEIGYLIFFATFVAYFLIPFGQQRIRPTLVSLYNYLQPIIATFVSIWVGLDVLTWQKVLAIALIVAGVMLVNRSRAARS